MYGAASAGLLSSCAVIQAQWSSVNLLVHVVCGVGITVRATLIYADRQTDRRTFRHMKGKRRLWLFLGRHLKFTVTVTK